MGVRRLLLRGLSQLPTALWVTLSRLLKDGMGERILFLHTCSRHLLSAQGQGYKAALPPGASTTASGALAALELNEAVTRRVNLAPGTPVSW